MSPLIIWHKSQVARGANGATSHINFTLKHRYTRLLCAIFENYLQRRSQACAVCILYQTIICSHLRGKMSNINWPQKMS